MAEKLLAILFSLTILVQGWLVGARAGTWLLPGSIFGFFWFLYTFIPLVALPAVPANPMAVAYIAVCAMLFSVSSLMFDWSGALKENISREQRVDFDSGFIRLIFWSFSSLTLVSIFINWSIQGLSLIDLMTKPLETAGSFVDRKYRGLLVPNFFATLSVVLVYPSVILGGLIFGSRRSGKSRAHVLFVALLPAVLVMLAEGNKGSLPLVLVLYWAGVLITRINDGRPVLLGNGFFRQGAVIALFFAPLVLVAFLARGLSNLEDFELIVEFLGTMFASYTFGHLYAFADWFSSYTGQVSLMTYDPTYSTAGFYTFMPVYELFALGKEVPPGIYEEYFNYREMFETNIYTAFRGLITDFGLAGGMVIIAFLGAIVHAAAYRMVSLRHAPFATAIYAHSIGFCYSSFVISFLIWDSIYASVLLVAAVLLMNGWLTRPVARRS